MDEVMKVEAHDSEILCLEYSKPETGTLKEDQRSSEGWRRWSRELGMEKAERGHGSLFGPLQGCHAEEGRNRFSAAFESRIGSKG